MAQTYSFFVFKRECLSNRDWFRDPSRFYQQIINLPSCANLETSWSRSSLRVQQIQPFDISTNFSSVLLSSAPPFSTRHRFTSLISLTITATFLPSRLFEYLIQQCCLPAPKNPDNTVTGNRFSMLLGSSKVLTMNLRLVITI